MFGIKNPVIGLIIGTIGLVGGTIISGLGGGLVGEGIGKLLLGK